jgi:hypothetical protein
MDKDDGNHPPRGAGGGDFPQNLMSGVRQFNKLCIEVPGVRVRMPVNC